MHFQFGTASKLEWFQHQYLVDTTWRDLLLEPAGNLIFSNNRLTFIHDHYWWCFNISRKQSYCLIICKFSRWAVYQNGGAAVSIMMKKGWFSVIDSIDRCNMNPWSAIPTIMIANNQPAVLGTSGKHLFQVFNLILSIQLAATTTTTTRGHLTSLIIAIPSSHTVVWWCCHSLSYITFHRSVQYLHGYRLLYYTGSICSTLQCYWGTPGILQWAFGNHY